MSAGKAIGAAVILATFALVIVIMYNYGLLSVATTDVGVNLTGTQYQSAYNESINASQVGFSTLSTGSIVFGLLAVVSGLMVLFAVIPRNIG